MKEKGQQNSDFLTDSEAEEYYEFLLNIEYFYVTSGKATYDFLFSLVQSKEFYMKIFKTSAGARDFYEFSKSNPTFSFFYRKKLDQGTFMTLKYLSNGTEANKDNVQHRGSRRVLHQ